MPPPPLPTRHVPAQSDIADGSLRNFEFSSFNNIVGDYYIAPSFLDKVTMHVAKNYLAELGLIDHKTKVRTRV